MLKSIGTLNYVVCIMLTDMFHSQHLPACIIRATRPRSTPSSAGRWDLIAKLLSAPFLIITVCRIKCISRVAEDM